MVQTDKGGFELLDKIKQAACGCVTALGYEMVDLNFSKTKSGLIVRFLVDKPTGGITVEECSLLNERLGEALDNENIIEGGYTLEVSSPGVDRPLRTEKDFIRAIKRQVRIFLNEPMKGKWEIEARITEVKDGVVSVYCQDTLMNIPLNKIKKAKQVIE